MSGVEHRRQLRGRRRKAQASDGQGKTKELRLKDVLGCPLFAAAAAAAGVGPRTGRLDHREIHRLEHVAKLRKRVQRALAPKPPKAARKAAKGLGAGTTAVGPAPLDAAESRQIIGARRQKTWTLAKAPI